MLFGIFRPPKCGKSEPQVMQNLQALKSEKSIHFWQRSSLQREKGHLGLVFSGKQRTFFV